MYIPEFWCGVGITVILEIGLIVIYGIFKNGGKK